ncbi:MAG: YihA family ribosome biogenesis GTP-binding protein [Oscillospiraceae bacterium]|nr:YihA family ribosome biogenesis GTP-binding protein [Oscillospiraceae bacterium]
MNLQKVEFIKSAAQPNSFVNDNLPQIAFSGKSNVGKSSVLNCVLQRKNFARVGQKPGKTVHINYFRVDGKAYFVDLPGYGYAQVAESEKERWGKLMEAYFAQAERITLGVMIVDARHAPTKLDVVMAELFQNTGRPFVVVANKLDKLKKSEIEPNMACIRADLKLTPDTALIPFSAEKGAGRGELVNAILRAVEK